MALRRVAVAHLGHVIGCAGGVNVAQAVGAAPVRVQPYGKVRVRSFQIHSFTREGVGLGKGQPHHLGFTPVLQHTMEGPLQGRYRLGVNRGMRPVVGADAGEYLY